MSWITPKLGLYALIATLVLVATATAGYIAYDALPTAATLNVRDGQTEVPLNQRLILTLNHPADLGALSAALHIEPALQGRLARSASGTTFTWSPDQPWNDLTVYTVRLAALEQSGRTVQPRQWKFRTTIVPRVLAVSNEGAGNVAEGADVRVGGTLRITFNDALDETSVHLLLNGKPADLSWLPGSEAATFQTTGYPVGPIELTLAPGGHDLRGHSLAAGWRFHLNLSFRVDVRTVNLKFPAIVQIPNERDARDQSGLTAADAVFEYLTEGGITRLSAIFSRAPDAVGPVRSGRLISFALTRHYRGQLFLSGLSAGSQARLRADPVAATFDFPGRGYYRSPARRAPDNLYITGAAIQADLGNDGDATQLKKAAPVFRGDDGTSLTVAPHNTSYAFDPKSGAYLKTEDGRIMADALIGQPLKIQMVVVMRARSAPTTYAEDVTGARGLDFDLESGGRADFYFQGKHAAGTWSAPDRNSAFTFKTDAGEVVTMPGGLVWIEVL